MEHEMNSQWTDYRLRMQRSIRLHHAIRSDESDELFDPEQLAALFTLRPALIHVYEAALGSRKGFGLHELGAAADRKIRNFTAACRERDIRVLVYRCVHTLRRDLLDEHPEAEAWLTRGPDGANRWQAFYDTPDRLAGCINNPGWLAHQQAVLRHSIELGFQGMFYDNAPWFECHCDYCQDAFAAWLQAHGRPAHALPLRADWSSQLWHDYYQHASERVGDVLGEWSRLGKDLCPGHFTYTNTTPPVQHPPSDRMLDGDLVARHCDGLLYESGTDAPGFHLVQLRWNIESMSYGVAEARGRGVHYVPYYRDSTRPLDKFLPNRTRLNLAEAFVFGFGQAAPDMSFSKYWDTFGPVKAYYDFFEHHGAAIAAARYVGDVGVYFSGPSMRWHTARLQQELFHYEWNWPKPLRKYGAPDHNACIYCLAKQHLTFRTVRDRDLLQEPPDCQILMLPNVGYVTKAEAERLRQLVHDGLSLYASGVTSLYDRADRRETFLLADLFGVDALDDTTRPMRRSVGRGRVVYDPDRPEMTAWAKKPPAAALRAHLDWLAGDNWRFTLESPSFPLLATAFEDATTLYIHLLNYNIDEESDACTPAQNIRLRLPHAVRSVTIESPDDESPGFTVDRRNDDTEICLGKVVVYSLIIVTL
jgi:hypothetical protein